jgi:antitoxin (DNA-binding transcriptional repressor) of toxin-antitoxin stability system
MKFITVRDLRGRPAEVWTKLSRDKELVLTSNGKPIAILSAVSEDTLEGSLVALRQARAIAAVEALQSHSAAAGTDKLSLRRDQRGDCGDSKSSATVRVVMDTNVLVAGLLSPFGRPGEVVRMIAAGSLSLL